MEELARDLNDRISPSGLKGSAFDTSHWRSEHATLAAWHDAFNLPTIEARVRPGPTSLKCASSQQRVGVQIAAVSELMHEQVVFHPPTYFQQRDGKAFAIWALKVGTTLASSLMHLMCVTCAPEKGAGAIKEG
jgi:hypothetical protein